MKIFEWKKITTKVLFFFIFIIYKGISFAAIINDPKLNLWINEAIASTYTYDAAHLIARQKIIAQYFTIDGWMNYSKALKESKILDVVQKNNYVVAAIPMAAPKVEINKDNQIIAVMPIIVTYHGENDSQTQALEVKILINKQNYDKQKNVIERLWAQKIDMPCGCENKPCNK